MSEGQPFYDFVATDSDHLSDADYNIFQAEIIGIQEWTATDLAVPADTAVSPASETVDAQQL